MAKNPLIIHNTYLPKPGEGVAMRQVLLEQDVIWREHGFPGFQILKPYDGPHHAIVTVQRWESFAQWDDTRHEVPKVPECRSLVFDRLYPLTATPYETRMLEEIPGL